MSPLTATRVGLGLAATLKGLELWPVLQRLAADPLVVPMPLAPWPRPSVMAVNWLAAAWAGLGLTVAAGKAVPVTAALLAAVVGYVTTLDQQTYSNHLYLLALFAALLALAHTKACREPALALLRWQLAIVYAFAAASKINGDFLSGRVLAENLHPSFGLPDAGLVPAALAVAAVVTEAAVAACLLHPPWRRTGIVLGLALHAVFVVAIVQTLAMIGFALICLSVYPLYVASTPPGPRA